MKPLSPPTPLSLQRETSRGSSFYSIWLKCLVLSHRLKKNLKMFIIVHPSWFIRTLLGITKPFIRSHCWHLTVERTLNRTGCRICPPHCTLHCYVSFSPVLRHIIEQIFTGIPYVMVYCPVPLWTHWFITTVELDQVDLKSTNNSWIDFLDCTFVRVFLSDYLFSTAPSSAVRSNMWVVCRSLEKSFQWNMSTFLPA